MNILIGFEESGIGSEIFRAKGHTVYSCDLEPTRGDPEWHLQCDIMEALVYNSWDLVILHPVCTALSVSGNGTYAKGKPKHTKRLTAIKYTESLWDLCIKKFDQVCFENPVGVLSSQTHMPKPQYVQPWMFGHKETKKTALYLHNLPKLRETSNVKAWVDLMPSKEKHKVWYASPGKDRAKIRSQSYSGMFQAMADQWK